ncbi:MAG: sigma-70 family RNA polymerase sigma factor [Spirosomataceae bacterium]
MSKIDPCHDYRTSERLFYEALRIEAPGSFSCLYLQTYELCLPYAIGKGSDQSDAEDLLQECLAIFVEKLRSGDYVFQEGAKITTYFYRVYMNQWKKAFEKKSKRGEVRLQLQNETQPEDEEPYKEKTADSPFRAILYGEEGEEESVNINDAAFNDYDDDERVWVFKKLTRAFSLLAEDCQRVLTWFYVEDWSLRQIADELGMTEASATVKRFKCAKYLKEKFRLA